MTDARRAELAANLATVEARIADACAAAGRSRSEVRLIAVTKTFPASDVRLLAELGVTDIGENRDQDAAAKAAQCADLRLTWHFVGQLQTNKCRSVVTYADYVHSVDRPRLVEALGKAAHGVGRTIGCLVEVRLDAREGRAGVPAEEAGDLAAKVAATDGLRLAGVMGVAPLGGGPEARGAGEALGGGPGGRGVGEALDGFPDKAFGALASVARALRAEHPDAVIVSAGMSGDLEAAVRHGATHVRIGTALLGMRPTYR